jgi:hypothetical protein
LIQPASCGASVRVSMSHLKRLGKAAGRNPMPAVTGI